jgi:hypothetical protein
MGLGAGAIESPDRPLWWQAGAVAGFAYAATVVGWRVRTRGGLLVLDANAVRAQQRKNLAASARWSMPALTLGIVVPAVLRNSVILGAFCGAFGGYLIGYSAFAVAAEIRHRDALRDLTSTLQDRTADR